MKTYENALQIIADNYAIIGKERHELAAMVIDKYKSSTEPLFLALLTLTCGKVQSSDKMLFLILKNICLNTRI